MQIILKQDYVNANLFSDSYLSGSTGNFIANISANCNNNFTNRNQLSILCQNQLDFEIEYHKNELNKIGVNVINTAYDFIWSDVEKCDIMSDDIEYSIDFFVEKENTHKLKEYIALINSWEINN